MRTSMTYLPDRSVTWTKVSLKEAKMWHTPNTFSPSATWGPKLMTCSSFFSFPLRGAIVWGRGGRVNSRLWAQGSWWRHRTHSSRMQGTGRQRHLQLLQWNPPYNFSSTCFQNKSIWKNQQFKWQTCWNRLVTHWSTTSTWLIFTWVTLVD